MTKNTILLRVFFFFLVAFFVVPEYGYAASRVRQYRHSIVKNEQKRDVAIKKQRKGRWKKVFRKWINAKTSNVEKKPKSFWVTLFSGIPLFIIFAIGGAPFFAYLFPFGITVFGLIGYFLFRKKHDKAAKAFLITAMSLNFSWLALAGLTLYLFSIWNPD